MAGSFPFVLVKYCRVNFAKVLQDSDDTISIVLSLSLFLSCLLFLRVLFLSLTPLLSPRFPLVSPQARRQGVVRTPRKLFVPSCENDVCDCEVILLF